jgi:hypothetical protein
MNYIGSKYSLLAGIETVLDRYRIPRDGIALDLFAGTGAVAQLLKLRGHVTYANDWQFYSYVTSVAFLAFNEFPEFANLLSDRMWEREIKATPHDGCMPALWYRSHVRRARERRSHSRFLLRRRARPLNERRPRQGSSAGAPDPVRRTHTSLECNGHRWKRPHVRTERFSHGVLSGIRASVIQGLTPPAPAGWGRWGGRAHRRCITPTPMASDSWAGGRTPPQSNPPASTTIPAPCRPYSPISPTAHQD